MTSFTTHDSKRMVQLDVLRGVAVLLVMGHHIVLQPNESGVFQPVENVLIRFGWSGVDLFFVLSGFLVGGLLFAELRARGKLDVRRFIIRRGFKIWPSYFVYLFVVFLILLAAEHGNAHRALGHILPNFFHVQNYLGTARPHTWSLAVEEHFYVFLPLLLLVLTLRKRNKQDLIGALPIIGIAIIVGCTSLRYVMNAGREYDPATHYNPTHLRMDSLFFGVLLGYFYHFKSTWLAKIGSYRYTLLFAGMAMVLPMTIIDIRYSWFVPVFGFLMLYLGYGLILLAVIYTPLSEGILGSVLGSSFGRVLAFIGFFSYPIYLWHIDLARLPLQALARTGFLSVLSPTWRWIAFTLIYVTLATSAGVVLGLLVERPALALRDRFFPSRTRAAVNLAVASGNDHGLSGVKSTDPELVEVGS